MPVFLLPICIHMYYKRFFLINEMRWMHFFNGTETDRLCYAWSNILQFKINHYKGIYILILFLLFHSLCPVWHKKQAISHTGGQHLSGKIETGRKQKTDKHLLIRRSLAVSWFLLTHYHTTRQQTIECLRERSICHCDTIPCDLALLIVGHHKQQVAGFGDCDVIIAALVDTFWWPGNIEWDLEIRVK